MSPVVDRYYAEETVDLRAVVAKLLEQWRWIAASVVVFAVLFTTAAFLMRLKYRATVVLTPAVNERGGDVLGFAASKLGALGALAGLGGSPADQETEEALAVLHSQQFTESFIAQRNLMPELFASKWDAATGKWKVDAEHQPTPAKAYKYFDRKIRSVVQDKKTGLVAVQIDWIDRNEAADWANDLVRRLNEEMRARAIARADASLRFLEKELQTSSTVEVRDSVSHLIEAQVKQRMLADVNQDYCFRVVDRAIPADRDDPVSPQRPLLLLLGPLVGFAVGSVLVLMSGSRAPQRSMPRSTSGTVPSSARDDGRVQLTSRVG